MPSFFGEYDHTRLDIGQSGFPSLSVAQNGKDTFIESRLGRAAFAQGQWKNVAGTSTQQMARALLDKINSGEKLSGGILQVDCSKGTAGKIFDKKWV